jgi:hypothetical protein
VTLPIPNHLTPLNPDEIGMKMKRRGASCPLLLHYFPPIIIGGKKGIGSTHSKIRHKNGKLSLIFLN